MNHLDQEPSPGDQGAGTVAGPARPPLVLIVEDEPSIANLLEMLLQDEGYRTLKAGTGSEAEELARRYHPDLVILDLYLPDKPGVEVLQTLKSSPDTASIPIVVVSAYTQLLAPEETLRELEVVPKPFDVDHLLEVIRRVLKSKAGVAPPEDELQWRASPSA